MLRHSIESIEVKVEKASKFRRQMDKWSLTRNITGACQGSMITVVEFKAKQATGSRCMLTPCSIYSCSISQI